MPKKSPSSVIRQKKPYSGFLSDKYLYRLGSNRMALNRWSMVVQNVREKDFSVAFWLTKSFESGGKRLDNEEIGLTKPSVRQLQL